jgi:hypothetical protein
MWVKRYRKVTEIYEKVTLLYQKEQKSTLFEHFLYHTVGVGNHWLKKRTAYSVQRTEIRN